MLRALGWTLKITIFSFAILLAGEWIHWQGRTLSQHVRGQAEQVLRTDFWGNARRLTRQLTQKITSDARIGSEKRSKQSELTDEVRSQAAAPQAQTSAMTEEPIAPSERQKLRALIRELNHSKD